MIYRGFRLNSFLTIFTFQKHCCNGHFQKFFVTHLLRKSYPLEFYLIFLAPSWNSTEIRYPQLWPPPLEFSNFKHNPLEFSRLSFLWPPGISVILNRGDPENIWKSPMMGGFKLSEIFVQISRTIAFTSDRLFINPSIICHTFLVFRQVEGWTF